MLARTGLFCASTHSHGPQQVARLRFGAAAVPMHRHSCDFETLSPPWGCSSRRSTSGGAAQGQAGARSPPPTNQDVLTAVEALGTRLGGVDKRLGGVETRLDGVDKRLGGVETRLDGQCLYMKRLPASHSLFAPPCIFFCRLLLRSS